MATIRMSLAHPRYWLSWFGLGILHLLAHLPFRGQKALACFLGRLLFIVDAKHRRIAGINVKLCFPELSSQKRTKLCQDSFQYTVWGAIVMATVWFVPQKIIGRFNLHGEENVHNAFEQGRGVLLLGIHQTFMEVGLFVGKKFPLAATYRKHPNQLFDKVVRSSRGRYCSALISSRQIRDVLKSMNKVQINWMTADQDAGRQGAVFSKFFGITAATLSSVPRIEKIANVVILPFSLILEEDEKFHMRIGKPVTFNESQSLQSRVDALNKVMEDQIRRHPGQYLWLHRKFKTQPYGVLSPYE